MLQAGEIHSPLTTHLSSLYQPYQLCQPYQPASPLTRQRVNLLTRNLGAGISLLYCNFSINNQYPSWHRVCSSGETLITCCKNRFHMIFLCPAYDFFRKKNANFPVSYSFFSARRLPTFV